jgi:hypothetical protein
MIPLGTDLVLRDPKGIHGGGIPLLFKIELQGDFSPMDPLGIPCHQISPSSAKDSYAVCVCLSFAHIQICIPAGEVHLVDSFFGGCTGGGDVIQKECWALGGAGHLIRLQLCRNICFKKCFAFSELIKSLSALSGGW